MASPLQIILNDKDYQEARDAGGGGLKKDFFANRDREFREHKKALSAHAQQPAMPMMRRRNPRRYGAPGCSAGPYQLLRMRSVRSAFLPSAFSGARRLRTCRCYRPKFRIGLR
jgi:hypothetical protein